MESRPKRRDYELTIDLRQVMVIMVRNKVQMIHKAEALFRTRLKLGAS